MKTFPISLILLVGIIAADGADTTNLIDSTANRTLPELIDKAEPTINGPITGEPRMLEVWAANWTNIDKISHQDSRANRLELRLRLADDRRPPATRLLYAAILAAWEDTEGQEFLLQQCQKANSFEDIENSFWLMGHLDWFQPRHPDEVSPKPIDMHWAEPFMLKALQDTREFSSTTENMNESETVQSFALDDSCGDFAERLAAMKSPKLFPILVKLFNAGNFSTRIVCQAFDELGDQRAVPLLLKALPTSNQEDDFGRIAIVLADLHCNEAIPILLTNLDNYDTYYALPKYSDPRILPALTNALPNLHNDYARGAARILIIQLEGGDELPKLIALAEDPNDKCMDDPLWLIAELKDKRAVPFAVQVLNTSPDIYARVSAIRILAAIPDSREAVIALIDALDIDFNAMAKGKEIMENENVRTRQEISTDLQKMTGQNFGTDKKRWQAWLAREPR